MYGNGRSWGVKRLGSSRRQIPMMIPSNLFDRLVTQEEVC